MSQYLPCFNLLSVAIHWGDRSLEWLLVLLHFKDRVCLRIKPAQKA